MNFEHILWLFLCFSLLGWVMETTLAAIRTRRYVDRSVLFGPWCIIYGISGTLITMGLAELRSGIVFLFLGSCWKTSATPAGGTTRTAVSTWTATSV